MKRLFLVVLLLWGVGQAQQQKVLEEQIAAYQKVLEAREAELSALAAQLSETNTQLDAQLAERDRLSSRIL